ncbi:uncharacterized protein LOC111076137 [Drosophila obscura]|uniref:uncharacterized protein LOC111076137 n=1 Tax=Drosophila obscura TaxID=7282 RepID=UPI001BB0EE02|nr:uncharacterized protein LOC111076137 [Drosophila obscura]
MGRLWLLAVILCWIMAQTENKKHFGLYDGCVKKNLYMHESVCPGPYRFYFTFHRVLFDCIRVRTKCPRIHKYNEYDTLKECQSDCAELMVVPEETKDNGNETTT